MTNSPKRLRETTRDTASHEDLAEEGGRCSPEVKCFPWWFPITEHSPPARQRRCGCALKCEPCSCCWPSWAVPGEGPALCWSLTIRAQWWGGWTCTWGGSSSSQLIQRSSVLRPSSQPLAAGDSDLVCKMPRDREAWKNEALWSANPDTH